jgi:molecular chaperone HtpG
MAKTQTKIGKAVIESLTLGMYEDSRFIFREYIQNSADQIDKALADEYFSTLRDGKIEINVDPNSKTISIRDNATGIESNKVESVLKNIAQSSKDRTKNKGFRGIGRLGGIAYCDILIFETSFKGEETKSLLCWNSQKLKGIINNRFTKEEAVTVIDDVTEYKTEPESKESHYFKVTLQGVTNKTLLDKENIYQYLSMVAPVPYKKGFIFKNKIHEKARQLDFQIDEYQVFINGNQVFKDYTTSIYEGNDISNKKKIDEVHDIETFEIKNSNNDLLAWGWYSISSLIKQMPKINKARSIRLRKGNIEIGLEKTLDKLFKDSRWSKYYFGEVHAVSSELIPNSRRDYFLETDVLLEFELLLKTKFIELEKLNYYSSNIRSNKKKIDDFINFSEEYKKKSTKDGFTNNDEKETFKEKFEIKKEKANQAKEELKKLKEKKDNGSLAQQRIFEKIVGKKEQKVENILIPTDQGKTKFITDNITKLNRKDRKLVSRIFEIVDIILTPDIASLLKEKIKEELNK